MISSLGFGAVASQLAPADENETLSVNGAFRAVKFKIGRRGSPFPREIGGAQVMGESEEQNLRDVIAEAAADSMSFSFFDRDMIVRR